MTQRPGRGWPTIVLLSASLLVGRWLTGPGLGFGLFALAWLPIAAVCLPAPNRFLQNTAAVLVAGLTAGGIGAYDASMSDAVRSVVLVTVWALAVLAGGDALASIGPVVRRTRQFSSGCPAVVGQTASALTAICWLTWLTLPLTRADGLNAVLTDAWLTRIWSQHPVLALNATLTTAPDWTHAVLAYKYLTPLGQDVPFDWPSPWWISLVLPAGLLLIALASKAAVRLFHVEQASIVAQADSAPLH